MMTLQQALLGGPGLDGYAYCADTYCVTCGQNITCEVFAERHNEPLHEWEAQDSETLPQPIFFGESPDCAQHCALCGEYLYGEDSDDDES